MKTQSIERAKNKGKNTNSTRRIKSEKLNDFCEMYRFVFGMNESNHDRAAEFFGVSARTCRRWYASNTPHPTAHRHLHVHFSGYLPYTNGWADMRIDENGVLHTPYGRCTAGDLAMLWRYKWSAAQTTRSLKALNVKIQTMQSSDKLQALINTAHSLTMLVNDLSGKSKSG
jgi:hypothetical protein